MTRNDLSPSRIVELLDAEYGVSVHEISQLFLGADVHTLAYRAVAANRREYFLKLRTGSFVPESVTIPHWLATAGMTELVPPIPTRSGRLWTVLDTHAVTLYPFVSGSSGWEARLSQQQWIALGGALGALHSLRLPAEPGRAIPREDYSPEWRAKVRAYLSLAQPGRFTDPNAIGLCDILTEKRDVVEHIVARSDELAVELSRRRLPERLCHGDIHAGNILVDSSDRLLVIDWDTLQFAPRERDLMFIGGGVGGVWNERREVEWFYSGYGSRDIDSMALTYYRFERIVQDIGEFCEELLVDGGGPHDGTNRLSQFASQFESGNVVKIALATDRQARAGGQLPK